MPPGISSIFHFQVKITGSLLISWIYSSIRFFKSSFESALIPLSMERAILLKNISIMLSQDACVGVKTKWNLHGLDERYFIVSFDV